MRTAEDLISSLDLIAPKNPKNDWSKICRSIVNDAIEYIKNHEEGVKEAFIAGYQHGWNDESSDCFLDEQRFEEWNN